MLPLIWDMNSVCSQTLGWQKPHGDWDRPPILLPMELPLEIRDLGKKASIAPAQAGGGSALPALLAAPVLRVRGAARSRPGNTTAGYLLQQ